MVLLKCVLVFLHKPHSQLSLCFPRTLHTFLCSLNVEMFILLSLLTSRAPSRCVLTNTLPGFDWLVLDSAGFVWNAVFRPSCFHYHFPFALDLVFGNLEVCFYKTHHPSFSKIPELLEIGFASTYRLSHFASNVIFDNERKEGRMYFSCVRAVALILNDVCMWTERERVRRREVRGVMRLI